MKRALIMLTVAVAFFYVGKVGWDVVNKVKAKETMTHMRRLAALLTHEKPENIGPPHLRQLLARYAVSPTYLLDGWERPLLVERVKGVDGVQHYRVTSLGRDGQRGGCCRRFLDFAWAEDAVIEDEVWLQAW